MIDVILTRAAEKEYASALAWHHRKGPWLARWFRAAVQEGLARIAEFPEASPRCDEKHRYCVLKRFNYGLVYRYQHGFALVVAVTHGSQLPGYWNE